MNNYSIIKKSILRYSIVLLMFIFSIGINLEGLAKTRVIDSLKLLELTADEQYKPSLYSMLTKYYSYVNLDSAIYYGNKGLKLSMSLDIDNEYIIDQLLLLSSINTSMGNYTNGRLLLHQAEDLCIAGNNYDLLAKVKFKIGEYYYNQENYAENLNSLNSAMHIIEENNFSNLKPILYIKLGMLYLRINDLKYAETFRKKAFESSILIKDNNIHISSLLLEADILLKRNKLDSSYICYKAALKIAKESNLSDEIRKTYRHIAKYWIVKNNYKKAISNVNLSIAYCKELGLITELSALLTYKAHIYSKSGELEKTLECNLESLKLREYSGNLKLICTSCINIGGNYTELGDYDSAIYYLTRGLKIAKTIGNNLYLAYGYGKLAELYTSQDNYEEAFVFTKLNIQYNDLVLISKTNDKVLFFKNQYKLEQEKSISKSLINEIRTLLVFFLVAIMLVSTIGIFFLVKANLLRKEALNEMKKLSQVVENISQAVLIIDTNGKITYVNNGLLKMTNYPSNSYFIDKSVLDLATDNGAKQIKDDILPALRETGNWHGEVLNKKYNGDFFITEEVCSVIKSKDGKPKYYVAIYNDISDRKKEELKLKQNREKLKLAVEARDKMFSIIAHDLTGPFGSILGFSKLLATEFHDYQTEDHKRFSSLIYESSKTTFDLLTNLLHWSRAQLGTIKLFIDNVNLKILVDENIELLKPMIDKRGTYIQNQIPDNISAKIDYDTISIVIKNLILNAISYSPYNSKVIITSEKSNDSISIKISDKGYGIKSEKLENLFNISVDKSGISIKDQKGSGLGLLLCKELITLNKGTISVQSKFGIGSDFILNFPINTV